MAQPPAYSPANNFAAEVGLPWGLHLDTELASIASVFAAIEANLSIIQRDDTALANQSVGANTFASDALALIAGAQSASDRWTPKGFWATATLYNVSDIVETGSPGVAYVCAVQHTSGTFATDHAAGKWVVLSAPRTIVSADVTGALGFTPVNKAGDTMTGALAMVTASSIAGMTFANTLMASQNLLTANAGWYVQYASSLSAQLFGFAANVVRSGGTGDTIGDQASALSSQTANTIFGGNHNAIGLAGATAPLVGHEADMACFEPTNASAKVGYNPVFKNRGDGLTNPGQYSYALPSGTYSNAGQGVGANLYNRLSRAIFISSQQRTASGEYCGWTRGVYFDEYGLDSELDASFSGSRAYPIGIDFSNIHYYGGTDPVTSYNMEAAIAFRDYQGILWNRDATAPGAQVNKVRSYFNPSTGRWVLTNAGNEKFAIDVTTGSIYQNGSLFTGGASLSANNTWTGANTFNQKIVAAASGGAALNFSANGARITGNFNDSTYTNRPIFQTANVNAATEVGAIPSGTSTQAGFYLCSDPALTTGIVGRIGVDTTGVQISSGILGAASYQPLDFAAGGSTQMRLNASGQVLVGTTTAPAAGVKLRVAGIVQFDNAVAFSVNRNGVAQTIGTGTFTKVMFTTKEFDQNTSFDTVLSRFTPPAGTYLLSACLVFQGTVDQKRYATIIYKNGSALKNNNLLASGTDSLGSSVTCVVTANGSDYFEVYTWHNSGVSEDLTGLTTDCWFSGTKIA